MQEAANASEIDCKRDASEDADPREVVFGNEDLLWQIHVHLIRNSGRVVAAAQTSSVCTVGRAMLGRWAAAAAKIGERVLAPAPWRHGQVAEDQPPEGSTAWLHGLHALLAMWNNLEWRAACCSRWPEFPQIFTLLLEPFTSGEFRATLGLLNITLGPAIHFRLSPFRAMVREFTETGVDAMQTPTEEALFAAALRVFTGYASRRGSPGRTDWHRTVKKGILGLCQLAVDARHTPTRASLALDALVALVNSSEGLPHGGQYMVEPLCRVTSRLGRDALGSRAPALESWFVTTLGKFCEFIEEYKRQYGGDLLDGDDEQCEDVPDARCIVATLEQMNSEHAEAARSMFAAACA